MNLSKEIFSSPYWFNTSERLKFCADILIIELMKVKNEDSRNLNPIEYDTKIRALLETNLMLLGYSIENAIKSLLISNYLLDNTIPENADLTFLKNEVWLNCDGHNLTQLAKNANINLTQVELSLLKKLKKYVIWKGRYHIPKNQKEIEELIKPAQGDRHTSEDQKVATDFILKVKALIDCNSR